MNVKNLSKDKLRQAMRAKRLSLSPTKSKRGKQEGTVISMKNIFKYITPEEGGESIAGSKRGKKYFLSVRSWEQLEKNLHQLDGDFSSKDFGSLLKPFIEKNEELNDLLGQKNEENIFLGSRLKKEQEAKKKEQLEKKKISSELADVKSELVYVQLLAELRRLLAELGLFTTRLIPQIVCEVLGMGSTKELVKFAEEKNLFDDHQKVVRIRRVRGAKYKHQTTVLFSVYGVVCLAKLIKKNRRDFINSLPVASKEETRELEKLFSA